MKRYIKNVNNSRILYIIVDMKSGRQLSEPNPDDQELWDRVEDMEAHGRRNLCVVVYKGSNVKLSVDITASQKYYNEWDMEFYNKIKDEPNPTHDSQGRPYGRGHWDIYFGETSSDKWGDIISEKLKGRKISKRKDRADMPGGLQYEADRLGMDDMFELLEALEGMCYEGRAQEIDDSTYLVL